MPFQEILRGLGVRRREGLNRDEDGGSLVSAHVGLEEVRAEARVENGVVRFVLRLHFDLWVSVCAATSGHPSLLPTQRGKPA